MKDILPYIFYSNVGSSLNNTALLVFRILFALELFRVHGLKKFRKENGQTEHIPDPLHLPPKLNRFIATFSDTVVPFLLMPGIATRLVVLPAIGVTAIGYFVVHRKDNPEVRDVPYVYTVCLLLILMLGAGTYSVDNYFFKHL